MDQDLFSYLWALWGYARWLLAGGPFFVDALLKRIWPEASRWVDERIQPDTRTRIEVALLFLAVFSAGFFAWRDEHQGRLAAENKTANDQNQKRIAMKDLLSTSIAEGEALIKSHKQSKEQSDADAYSHEANAWATKTDNLVEDAYGKGEAAVWASDAGLMLINTIGYPTGRIQSWMVNRLQRSNELMLRVDTLPMPSTFDPNNYHWRTECPGC